MAPLSVVLAGCAHVAVEPDGTRRIAGFMVLTLPPATQDIGGDAVRIRALGLTVTRGHAAGAQVTLGYSDTTIATLRNDSVVSRTALRRLTHGQPPSDD
jgi:hypothetical protein